MGFRDSLLLLVHRISWIAQLQIVQTIENPLKSMAEIFEQAMDISLEKKDPKKKLERRLRRERERNASSGKSRPGEISASEGAPAGAEDKVGVWTVFCGLFR